MGKQIFLTMKFASVAVLALFLADSQAVLLQKDAKKDCGDVGCDKHVSYEFNWPDLRKAEADNVAKTQHFNGATKAAADATAGAAKTDAAAAFAGTNYHDPGFPAA